MANESRLGRVALMVDDVDAAAADFADLFDLEFTLFDIPAQQLRVAIGEHGLEFIQPLVDGFKAPDGGALSGVCIAVADVEARRAHIEARGLMIVMTIPLQSGRREYVFEPIHGLPVMIYQESGRFDPIAQ